MHHSSAPPEGSAVDPPEPPGAPAAPPGRRRRTLLVAGLVIVLVAVLVVAAGQGWRVWTARGNSVAADSVTAPLFDDLPSRLTEPSPVVDLPFDRGIGPAALFYYRQPDVATYDLEARTFAQSDVYLVTRTGEQFRVGRTPDRIGPVNVSLSVDGRWLASKRDAAWRVRDLTGTAEHEVRDGYIPWLWSTDAASLLLAKPGVNGLRSFQVMELPGGRTRQLDLSTSIVEVEVAFLAGRELVVLDPTSMFGGGAGGKVTVTLRDIDTGSTSRELTVVDPARLQPGETTGILLPLLHAGGNPPSVWVQVHRADPLPTNAPEGVPFTPPVAVLGVDLTTGAAIGRVETDILGVGSPGDPAGRSADVFAGVVADGVVLMRWTLDATELVIVDPKPGTRRVITTFPGLVRIIVPGERA
jgi:hypothetical protein